MPKLRTLLKDTAGGALVEGTLVFPMLLVLLFGLVEFGYVLWQYHSAEKATVVAARYVATRGPLVSALASGARDCFVPNPSTVVAGTPCSAASIPAAQGPIVCTPGATGDCQGAVLTAMANQMRTYAPFLNNANIQVQVSQSKLGFIGRGKAVPIVTVRTSGLTYNFIALDALLGFQPITMPSFDSSLTAEDQQEGPGT